MRTLHFFTLIIALSFIHLGHAQQVSAPDVAWAKAVNNSGQSSTTAIVTDEEGNIYVSGYFNTSITVNGQMISNPSGSNSSNYLIKYDADGNGIWGEKTPFRVVQLVVSNDALYVLGIYDYTISVQQYQGFPIPQIASGTKAYLLIKMDLNANLEWLTSIDTYGGVIGAMNFDKFLNVFIGQDKKIHLLGVFSNKIAFENGVTFATQAVTAYHAELNEEGSLDTFQTLGHEVEEANFGYIEYFEMDNEDNIYRYVKDRLIKYNNAGDTLYRKEMNPTGSVTITGLALDPFGNIFLSGHFGSSTMSLDGVAISNAGNGNDGIIVKADRNNGNVSWVKNFGWQNNDVFDHLLTDDIGNIYALSESGYGFLYGGQTLVVKYDNDGNEIWRNILETAGDGGNYPQETVMMSTPLMTLTKQGGNLLIAGWFKKGLKLSGDVIINENSNTGNNNTWGYFSQFGTCNTPSPTLNVSEEDICKGESSTLSTNLSSNYQYLWSNGAENTASIEVDSSGEYSVVAIADEECYGISEKTPIIVHPLPDTSVYIENNLLIGADNNNASYQWINCQDNMPISGATEQIFEPTTNGEYAVIVTSQNGCSDTSSCYVINTLNIENNAMLDNQITLYPNPISNEVNIQTDLDVSETYVFDLQGKQLKNTTSKKVNLSELSSGIYLIKVKLKTNEVWTSKVIKN